MNENDKIKIESNKDSEYEQEIRERFENRQNTARRYRIRQKALDNGSYFFNFISVVTAFYFVVSITAKYPIAWQIAFGFILVGILTLNEIAKRYCINEGAEGNRVWFAPLPLLMAISFYASFDGGNRFTVEKSTGPIVEYNSKIDSLNSEIAAIDGKIALWEDQTWKGKIVREARKGKLELESLKNDLIKQRTKLEDRDIERNDLNETEHKAEISNYGIVFGCVAGSADLFLLICLLIARTAERNARRLFGLSFGSTVQSERSESVQLDRSVKTVQNRSRERSNAPKPNAPDLTPELVSAPTKGDVRSEGINMELVQYTQRIAPQLAEIKEVKEGNKELEDKVVQLTKLVEHQNEQLNALKLNDKNERSEQVKTERQLNDKKKPLRNRKPNAKLVAEAKELYDNGSGMSLGQLAKKYGKAKSTIHNWVNS